MDNYIFIPSAVLSIVFIILYLFRIKIHKARFKLAVVINTVLLASGVVCGIALALGCFFEDINKHIKDIKLYVFIAGLAVLFVSIQGLHSSIILIKTEKEEKF